jgi:hypothetical protein
MKNEEKGMEESISERFEGMKEDFWEQVYGRASHSIDDGRQLEDSKSEVDSGKDPTADSVNYDADEDLYRSLPGTLLSDSTGKYFAYNLKIAKWVAEFTPFHRSLAQRSGE